MLGLGIENSSTLESHRQDDSGVCIGWHRTVQRIFRDIIPLPVKTG